MVKNESPSVANIRVVLNHGKERLLEALANCPLRPEQLISQAMVACYADEKLAKADPISVLVALTEAAQAQLQVNGALADGYLIPRWNKDRQCHEATFQVGYRGLLNLAMRSGKITHVDAQVVFENDVFDMEEGMHPTLRFRRNIAGDRGKPIGAYAVAYLRESPLGIHPMKFMSRAEIEHIRDTYSESAEYNSSPWKKEWAAMWLKTVLRQLLKFAQLSPQSQQAALLDEYHEAGVRTETERAELDRVAENAVPQVKSEKVEDLKRRISAQRNEAVAPPPVPAAPVAESAPAGKKREEVFGTVTDVKTKKDSKGRPFVAVMIDGNTITTWNDEYFGALMASKGKPVQLVVERDGKYTHLVQPEQIGDTEYHEGVPVRDIRADMPAPANSVAGVSVDFDDDVPF